MKNFADKLLEKIEEMKNPSCIGLDPKIEDIPDFLRMGSVTKTLFEFSKKIIDATFDIVPAFKIQIAFYEKYKANGIKALEKTIDYLKKKGQIVILDGKRNDIGPTARVYAEAFLSPGGFDADAITVNPYLGFDSIAPFIEEAIKYQRGIFVLVKTSNPSSRDLQDKILKNGQRFYEFLARKIIRWGRGTEGKKGYQIIGAVVGATFPQAAKTLRKIMRKNIFLVPGYGTQGGKSSDVIYNFNPDGRGAIVNSSRGIIFSYKQRGFKGKFKPQDFDLAAREAALKMKNDLNYALKMYLKR